MTKCSTSNQCQVLCALIDLKETCQCNTGYEIYDVTKCRDINECVVKNPCSGNSNCTNTLGGTDSFPILEFSQSCSYRVYHYDIQYKNYVKFSGFTCTCHSGYKKSANDPNSCVDRDGGWTQWNAWGTSSVTCSDGLKSHSRTCTNPKPDGAGAQCTGLPYESALCQLEPCPSIHFFCVHQFLYVLGEYTNE